MKLLELRPPSFTSSGVIPFFSLSVRQNCAKKGGLQGFCLSGQPLLALIDDCV